MSSENKIDIFQSYESFQSIYLLFVIKDCIASEKKKLYKRKKNYPPHTDFEHFLTMLLDT